MMEAYVCPLDETVVCTMAQQVARAERQIADWARAWGAVFDEEQTCFANVGLESQWQGAGIEGYIEEFTHAVRDMRQEREYRDYVNSLDREGV